MGKNIPPAGISIFEKYSLGPPWSWKYTLCCEKLPPPQKCSLRRRESTLCATKIAPPPPKHPSAITKLLPPPPKTFLRMRFPGRRTPISQGVGMHPLLMHAFLAADYHQVSNFVGESRSHNVHTELSSKGEKINKNPSFPCCISTLITIFLIQTTMGT